MAPKKVMKVKKLGLEKLRKVMKAGKAKAKASSSKGALGKATSSKGALEKAKGKKLNKSNLEKFGQMSLKDKIAAACEEGDGLEAAAEILKGSLTKDEHSQVWGKHQTALKNASALEKAEHAAKSKKEPCCCSLAPGKRGQKVHDCPEESEGFRALEKARQVEHRERDAGQVLGRGTEHAPEVRQSAVAGRPQYMGVLPVQRHGRLVKRDQDQQGKRVAAWL